MVYIGETGHSLNERIKEHKYAVKRGDCVATHVWEAQHAVDWSSISQGAGNRAVFLEEEDT